MLISAMAAVGLCIAEMCREQRMLSGYKIYVSNGKSFQRIGKDKNCIS